MHPLLFNNDQCYIEPKKKLLVNDLILLKKSNKLLIHRLIYKNKNYFVSKGDNNLQSDGKIYPNQIIGKVAKIKRKGKSFFIKNIYLVQSTLYLQEIIKIKKAFEKEKIEHVFLKGLPLHLYFEKSHPQRIYADCDILIKKEDFPKAEKIIKNFKYKNFESDKKVENNYFKKINGLTVVFDIHLEPAFLMTQFSGLEALYQQKLINNLTNILLNSKRNITVLGEHFYILGKKELVFYLALHLFHHNFRGAFRYMFLDKVIKKSRLTNKDWLKIADLVNNHRLNNFIYPVFLLLKKYYHPPVPAFFLKKIGGNHNFFNNKIMKTKIFDDETRTVAGINRFLYIFFLSSNSWAQKIFVFSNPDVLRCILLVAFGSIKRKLSSFFSRLK